MQAQTAVPAPNIDGTAATDVVQLSGVELLLSMITLLVFAAFVTSLIKWIALLRRGTRLFGEDALLPVRTRARPFWNPALFIFFFGVLIVASQLLNGWAIHAGWISKPAKLATRAQAVVVEDVVVPDSIEGVPLVPDAIAPDIVSPDIATSDAAGKGTEKSVAAGKPSAAPAISVAQLLLSSASMLVATIVTLLFSQLFRPLWPLSDSETDPSVPRERPRIGCLPQRGDIALGFSAAWLILPPTMLLMGLVSVLQKYSHPVLEALKPAGPDSAPDLGVFAALFFTTAIITPLVEEFWFRGMLQGGLQRLADMTVDARRYWNARTATPTPIVTDVPSDPTVDFNAQHTEPVSDDPYATPRQIDRDPIPPQNNISARQIARDQDTRSDWTPTAVWPIVVTSLVFAVMHWGQGLAPIPLFFLSLGLGYLYRQTGSLVPSIVVHFTLNGFTMCVTLLQFFR